MEEGEAKGKKTDNNRMVIAAVVISIVAVISASAPNSSSVVGTTLWKGGRGGHDVVVLVAAHDNGGRFCVRLSWRGEAGWGWVKGEARELAASELVLRKGKPNFHAKIPPDESTNSPLTKSQCCHDGHLSHLPALR